MNVLMTVDAVGGVWTYALELARALPDVRFAFAQMGPRPNDAQRVEVAALPNVRLFESEWKLEWQESPWDEFNASHDWLCQLSSDLRCDVVHLNGYSHGGSVFPRDIPCLVVAHSCVLSWWRAVKGEEAPRQWREYELRVGGGLRVANAVVAPTRAFAREIQRVYQPQREVEVVPNGASPGGAGASPREPFVLCAGRAWDEAKNFALLESAAARVPVRLAGPSTGLDTQNIHLLGRLERFALQDQLARAQVFAHPALYEPFGLSVLEAAQAGCALVLSDIPTLRELWEGAAVFCSPHDEEEWAQTLEFLLAHPAQCQTLGEKARARSRRYGREAFGQGYRALYERLTAPRRGVAPAGKGERNSRALYERLTA